MVKHEVDLAALSNYATVIFFFRRDDILYMSAEYTRDDHISLAIFAFFAYALGMIPGDCLQLPPPVSYLDVRKRHVDPPGLNRTFVLRHVGLGILTDFSSSMYPKELKELVKDKPWISIRSEEFAWVP